MKTKPLLTILAASALLLAAALTPAAASAPDRAELNGDPIDSATYRAWASNYRQLARYCAQYEDEFIVVPGYDRRIPNSRGLSRARAIDELTVTRRESRGGVIQTYSREPEDEEVDAYIHGLVGVTPGNYGDLISVKIVAILGPEEMLVADLRLIDREKLEEEYEAHEARARAAGIRDFRAELNGHYEHRLALMEVQDENEDLLETTHRLVGYPTRALRAGQVWEGPGGDGIKIAIARYEHLSEEQLEPVPALYQGDPRDPRLVLLNPEPAMRRTLDEQGMIELLDERGLTVAGFVEVMREVRDELRDPDEASQLLIERLLPPLPDPPERGRIPRSF